MAQEIELKLQISPKDVRKLLALPLLHGLPAQKQQLLNTYYDTPELSLRARRIALRFRKKGRDWLLTVKSAEPAAGGLAVRNEWETAATPGNFDFSHVDSPTLREFLDQQRDALTAVFTTDFQRHFWCINCGESQIEMALDQGHIAAEGRREQICEVELELLSGQVADLFALTRQLQHQLHLHPSIASKAERGYRLFTNEPMRPFRARALPMHARMRPVEAFRSIALGCLEHFQRNEAGLMAGGEAEFIHQARVALRRLRSAIKLFAPVLPAEFVSIYGQSWQTLACALGDARNWDVFLEETLPELEASFPHHHEVRKLRREAEKRVVSARSSIVKLLAVKEYPRLLLEFTAAVHSLDEVADGPSLPTLAAERIAVHLRSVRKMAVRYAELNTEERHKMRLRFKKLRYAMEFMLPLLPVRGMKTYLAALSNLQQQLGRVNDQVTARLLIEDVLGEVPGTLAMGWVAGREALLLETLPEKLDIWLKLKGFSGPASISNQPGADREMPRRSADKRPS